MFNFKPTCKLNIRYVINAVIYSKITDYFELLGFFFQTESDNPDTITSVYSPTNLSNVDISDLTPSVDSLFTLNIDEASEREIIFRRDTCQDAVSNMEDGYECTLTLDREEEETDTSDYNLECSQNDDYDESSETQPLYPGATVTVGSFMLILAAFTTKYNLVGDAIQQLLSIIAYALPSDHKLSTTLHEFKKYFSN